MPDRGKDSFNLATTLISIHEMTSALESAVKMHIQLIDNSHNTIMDICLNIDKLAHPLRYLLGFHVLFLSLLLHFSHSKIESINRSFLHLISLIPQTCEILVPISPCAYTSLPDRLVFQCYSALLGLVHGPEIYRQSIIILATITEEMNSKTKLIGA